MENATASDVAAVFLVLLPWLRCCCRAASSTNLNKRRRQQQQQQFMFVSFAGIF